MAQHPNDAAPERRRFPMTALAGRRVWEASRVGWSALALGTVVVWVVSLVR